MFRRIKSRKAFIMGCESRPRKRFLQVVPYGFKLLFGVGRYQASIYSKRKD